MTEDYSSSNKKRMLTALAVFLGADIDNDPSQWSDVPTPVKKEAKALYESMQLDKVTQMKDRLSEQQIQVQVAEAGIDKSIELYRIAGMSDGSTCQDCARWQGELVTMHPDGVHRTVQDFINEHGFHINCRCSLIPVSTTEIPRKHRTLNCCLNGVKLVYN